MAKGPTRGMEKEAAGQTKMSILGTGFLPDGMVSVSEQGCPIYSGGKRKIPGCACGQTMERFHGTMLFKSELRQITNLVTIIVCPTII